MNLSMHVLHLRQLFSNKLHAVHCIHQAIGNVWLCNKRYLPETAIYWSPFHYFETALIHPNRFYRVNFLLFTWYPFVY
jgi:hypothetical protein